MIKIKKTNREILEFTQNAEFLTRQLSTSGKRNRYLGVLQYMKEHFEKHSEAIQKKVNRIQEKHAKTKENGEFIYDGEGQNRQYVYTKETKVELEKELETFFDDVKELEVDPVFYLRKSDLPKDEKGEVILSNQLIKVLCDFVITKEVSDSLLYPGLYIKEENNVTESDK